MKPKTNEQIMKAFVKNASDMELVFARAWLADTSQHMMRNPNAYGDMWNPDMVRACAESIIDKMGFEKPKGSNGIKDDDDFPEDNADWD